MGHIGIEESDGGEWKYHIMDRWKEILQWWGKGEQIVYRWGREEDGVS